MGARYERPAAGELNALVSVRIEMRLTKRQDIVLKEISAHTQKPTKNRVGYSKFWSPKTHASLHEMGLVEYLHSSAILTDKGRELVEYIRGVKVCSH